MDDGCLDGSMQDDSDYGTTRAPSVYSSASTEAKVSIYMINMHIVTYDCMRAV